MHAASMSTVICFTIRKQQRNHSPTELSLFLSLSSLNKGRNYRISVHLFAYCLLLFNREPLITIDSIHLQIRGRVFCNLAIFVVIVVVWWKDNGLQWLRKANKNRKYSANDSSGVSDLSLTQVLWDLVYYMILVGSCVLWVDSVDISVDSRPIADR